MQVARFWFVLGSLLGGLAVAAAAVAAHAPLPPERLRGVLGAVQMQGWHALALLACGLLAPLAGWPAHAAGALFTLGLVLFCGAVWSPALGGPGLGAVAPVGGVALMLGWIALAWAGAAAGRG